MEVICFETEAFYALIEKVFERLKQVNIEKRKWLNTEQAMARLNIRSKSTLQKLRDAGSIRFSQPEKKWIVYDADSLDEYLDKHANDTFRPHHKI